MNPLAQPITLPCIVKNKNSRLRNSSTLFAGARIPCLRDCGARTWSRNLVCKLHPMRNQYKSSYCCMKPWLCVWLMWSPSDTIVDAKMIGKATYDAFGNHEKDKGYQQSNRLVAKGYQPSSDRCVGGYHPGCAQHGGGTRHGAPPRSMTSPMPSSTQPSSLEPRCVYHHGKLSSYHLRVAILMAVLCSHTSNKHSTD